MRRRLLLVGGVIACTSHKGPVSTMPVTEMEGDSVTVVVNGVVREGLVSRTRDGHVVADDDGIITIDAVERVTRTNRLFGALEGFGFGLVTGFSAGAALGFTLIHDECPGDNSDSCTFPPGKSAVFLGGAFGTIAGLAGIVIGAIAGQDDVWERAGTSPVRTVTAEGPPGSACGVTIRF